MSDDSRPTGVDPVEMSAAGRSGRCRRGWDTMTNDTTNSHDSDAQDENETVEDRLLGAFDCGTRGVHPDDLEIELPVPGERWSGKVGKVVVPEGGSVVFFDPDGETITEALALHDWEVSTVFSQHGGGTAVNVWASELKDGDVEEVR